MLLSGDRRQHGSFEHSTTPRLLEEEAGLKPAEVKETCGRRATISIAGRIAEARPNIRLFAGIARRGFRRRTRVFIDPSNFV